MNGSNPFPTTSRPAAPPQPGGLFGGAYRNFLDPVLPFDRTLDARFRGAQPPQSATEQMNRLLGATPPPAPQPPPGGGMGFVRNAVHPAASSGAGSPGAGLGQIDPRMLKMMMQALAGGGG